MLKKKFLTVLVLLITGAIFTYLFIGFLSPDPYYLGQMKSLYILVFLWGPRILIPAAYAFLIYLLLFANREVRKTTLVMGGVLAAFIFLLYPFANGLFMKGVSAGDTWKQYHPYLQLAPALAGRVPGAQRADTIMVFCLGGSTTEFRDSVGSGWTDRLEDMLNSGIPARPVRVFNLGRQWYTSLHTLINYEVNLRHLRPDVIIVMHAYNDLLHNADFSYLSTGPFREDYGHFPGPVSDLLRPETGLAGSIAKKFRVLWYHKPRSVVKSDHFPGLVSFERNLGNLIDLAEKDSVTVILMTQPNIYSGEMSPGLREMCIMVNIEAVGESRQWDFSTVYRGMKQYNNKTKEIAYKRKVYLIDLAGDFPKTAEFFRDEVHYTEKGFDLVAEKILNSILADSLSFFTGLKGYRPGSAE